MVKGFSFNQFKNYWKTLQALFPTMIWIINLLTSKITKFTDFPLEIILSDIFDGYDVERHADQNQITIQTNCWFADKKFQIYHNLCQSDKKSPIKCYH